MSGPKTSRYTLTPEQRRILEEQRKIERRKAVATEKIKKAQKQLLQIGRMFQADQQIAAELIHRTGNDNGITTLISELEALIAPVQPLVSRTNYDDLNSVEETANAVCAYLKEAEKLASKISSIAASNEGSLKANLSEAIDQGFATSFADIKEIKTDTVASLRIEAAQRLAQISKIDFLPYDYKCEISRASTRLEEIADEIFIKNFVAVSVNPLIKQANQFIAEYRECKAEFDERGYRQSV